MNKLLNGRIDIKTPNTSTLFEMYDKIPANQCATFRNPTEGLWDETYLSKGFFSQQNIQIIQNGIRAGVYKKSNGNYIIGEQSYDELKIVMRSIFLQSSTNLPTNIREQIEALNQLVVEYCVKQIYSEAQSYINYKHDVSTMYTPIDRPVQADYNNKTLELKHWF